MGAAIGWGLGGFISLFLLAMALVAIGLLFKKDLGARTFKNGVTVQNYELPNWLKWLHNPEDHLTGDKRGWYWCEYMAGEPAWLKMWWWSAWRNPLNYFKRVVIGVDVRGYTFHKLCGQDYVRDDYAARAFKFFTLNPKMAA